MPHNALGLIETKGLVGAITATDAAAKAASVVISSAELTDATFFTIRIEGELGAVQAAVDAAVDVTEKLCELVSVTVIPRPDDGLDPILPPRRFVSKYHPDDTRPPFDGDDPGSSTTTSPRPPRPSGGGGTTTTRTTASRTQTRGRKSDTGPEAPEQMSVAALRRYVRQLDGFPLKGREISRANKKTLLEKLRTFLKKD